MRKICHNGDKVLLLSDGQCKSLSMSYTCLSGLPVHIPASKWKGKYGLWLNAVVTLTQRSISGSRGVLYWKCWWFFYVNGKWLDTKAQNRAAKEDVLFSMWRLRGQLRLDLADCCASKRPHLMIQRNDLDCSPNLCVVWGNKTDFVLQLLSQR